MARELAASGTCCGRHVGLDVEEGEGLRGDKAGIRDWDHVPGPVRRNETRTRILADGGFMGANDRSASLCVKNAGPLAGNHTDGHIA